ncbi:MAG: 16S rRNA (guanine(966)-N(2))-methyltransferase RsmD [Rhodocyclaceae bacterium]|nr:16S rRNA (guanine(966)-N(2))-methyltransferase RsmD [Rhodocyclaceae bacterium]
MSFLRITGGIYRSRRIKVIDAPGLRPTPDAVRVTLFNWLAQDLSGWRCLDLFAGTGILGLECASRGAAEVVFVERNARIGRELRATLEAFSETPLTVWTGDALEFLALAERAGERFDLLLLDPPYRQGWIERLAPYLSSIVRQEGKIYLEAERPVAAIGAWRTLKRGQAGQVHYHLLEHS